MGLKVVSVVFLVLFDDLERMSVPSYILFDALHDGEVIAIEFAVLLHRWTSPKDLAKLVPWIAEKLDEGGILGIINLKLHNCACELGKLDRFLDDADSSFFERNFSFSCISKHVDFFLLASHNFVKMTDNKWLF